MAGSVARQGLLIFSASIKSTDIRDSCMSPYWYAYFTLSLLVDYQRQRGHHSPSTHKIAAHSLRIHPIPKPTTLWWDRISLHLIFKEAARLMSGAARCSCGRIDVSFRWVKITR